MVYGLSNDPMTPKVLEAARSAILATAWLLVVISYAVLQSDDTTSINLYFQQVSHDPCVRVCRRLRRQVGRYSTLNEIGSYEELQSTPSFSYGYNQSDRDL